MVDIIDSMVFCFIDIDDANCIEAIREIIKGTGINEIESHLIK